MKLLQQIVEGATSSSEPLPNLLRKCLVLSARLESDTLRVWARNELDGYVDKSSLPEYRTIGTHAAGHLQGPFGASIRNATLPPSCLDPEFQHWAKTAYLAQPIAAYEASVAHGVKENYHIPWPQDLVVLTQHDFYKGYNLIGAWLVVPAAAMIGLCDTVRNRVLDFALQLQIDSGNSEAEEVDVPPEQVTKYVTNIIYGNHNVLATNANDIINSGNSVVKAGDISSLESKLQSLGMDQSDIRALKEAIEKDGVPLGADPGPATSGWLGAVLMRAGKGGLKIGSGVAQAAITTAVMGYFGLS